MVNMETRTHQVCLRSTCSPVSNHLMCFPHFALLEWWLPTWCTTAIVPRLKPLPNPPTRPYTRSWPPSRIDRVSHFSRAALRPALNVRRIPGRSPQGPCVRVRESVWECVSVWVLWVLCVSCVWECVCVSVWVSEKENIRARASGLSAVFL